MYTLTSSPTPSMQEEFDDDQLGSGQSASGTLIMEDGAKSVRQLELLLERQNKPCLPLVYPARLPQGEGLSGWRDRNRQVVWLVQSSRRLGQDLATSSLAVTIFDTVLISTRVPSKYSHCVAAASLSLARKLLDDFDEDLSILLERLKLSYSSAELTRMELRILDALKWDAYLPTLYRFVEVLLNQIGAGFLLSFIRPHIEEILQDSNLIGQYKPSILAVSVVSLLVEATNKKWLHVAQTQAKLCKTDLNVVNRVRSRIAVLWNRHQLPKPSAYNLLMNQEGSNDMKTKVDMFATLSTDVIMSPVLQMQPTPC